MKKFYGNQLVIALLLVLSVCIVQAISVQRPANVGEESEFSLIGVNDGSEHEADEPGWDWDDFYALTSD